MLLILDFAGDRSKVLEEMQKEIIRVARALAEEGRMIMERGKQGDAFL